MTKEDIIYLSINISFLFDIVYKLLIAFKEKK